jgi:hypothetical protein
MKIPVCVFHLVYFYNPLGLQEGVSLSKATCSLQLLLLLSKRSSSQNAN